jgi:hypothetical protein
LRRPDLEQCASGLTLSGCDTSGPWTPQRRSTTEFHGRINRSALCSRPLSPGIQLGDTAHRSGVCGACATGSARGLTDPILMFILLLVLGYRTIRTTRSQNLILWGLFNNCAASCSIISCAFSPDGSTNYWTTTRLIIGQ